MSMMMDTSGLPILVVEDSAEDFEATSAHEEDIESCYRVGADGYVRKPVDPSGFTEVARNIKEFWLDTAILPTATGGAV